MAQGQMQRTLRWSRGRTTTSTAPPPWWRSCNSQALLRSRSRMHSRLRCGGSLRMRGASPRLDPEQLARCVRRAGRAVPRPAAIKDPFDLRFCPPQRFVGRGDRSGIARPPVAGRASADGSPVAAALTGVRESVCEYARYCPPAGPPSVHGTSARHADDRIRPALVSGRLDRPALGPA